MLMRMWGWVLRGVEGAAGEEHFGWKPGWCGPGGAAENADRSEHYNLRQRSAETLRTWVSVWAISPALLQSARCDYHSDGHNRFQTFQIKMDLEHMISGENGYFRAHGSPWHSSPIPGRWGPIGTVSGKAEFTISRSFKDGCSRLVVRFFFFFFLVIPLRYRYLYL